MRRVAVRNIDTDFDVGWTDHIFLEVGVRLDRLPLLVGLSGHWHTAALWTGYDIHRRVTIDRRPRELLRPGACGLGWRHLRKCNSYII